MKTKETASSGPEIECAKCHDRIYSRNRHDWRACRCGATFVDGGSSYLQCGGSPVMEDGTIKTWPVR